MTVDVVFAVKPDADYIPVSDDDFDQLYAAGALVRYRRGGQIGYYTAGTTRPIASATLEPSATVDVVFTILPDAGYVTVQRTDLPILTAAGLVLRYRDGGSIVPVALTPPAGAAYASSGRVVGAGTLNSAVTSNAAGSKDYPTAGTAIGFGTLNSAAYSTVKNAVTGTATGTGTLNGTAAATVIPQGKGEQGGKGLGGKGGQGSTSAAVVGRGSLSGTVTATPATVPSGYTTAGSTSGSGGTSGVAYVGTGGPGGTVDNGKVDSALVGGGTASTDTASSPPPTTTTPTTGTSSSSGTGGKVDSAIVGTSAVG